MDFKVIIGEKEFLTDQFHHALTFIKDEMAAWNNLYPENPLIITIEKVTSQTETLGASVNDELNIAELLGG